MKWTLLVCLLLLATLSVSSGQITDTSLQNSILAAINGARSAVSPAANTPIPAMVWNTTCAQRAQQWASTCNWYHDPNLNTYNMGQNLYASTITYTSGATTSDVSSFVGSWNAEKSFYTYATNACASGKMCGHYTQDIWAATKSVGCAIRSCAPLNGLYPSGTFFVCNFWPPGNYIGQKPYACKLLLYSYSLLLICLFPFHHLKVPQRLALSLVRIVEPLLMVAVEPSTVARTALQDRLATTTYARLAVAAPPRRALTIMQSAVPLLVDALGSLSTVELAEVDPALRVTLAPIVTTTRCLRGPSSHLLPTHQPIGPSSISR